MGLGLFFVLSPQFNQGTTGEGLRAGKGETGWLGFRAGVPPFQYRDDGGETERERQLLVNRRAKTTDGEGRAASTHGLVFVNNGVLVAQVLSSTLASEKHPVVVVVFFSSFFKLLILSRHF